MTGQPFFKLDPGCHCIGPNRDTQVLSRVTLPAPTSNNPNHTPTFDNTGRQTGGFGFINVINGLNGARTGQLVARLQF